VRDELLVRRVEAEARGQLHGPVQLLLHCRAAGVVSARSLCQEQQLLLSWNIYMEIRIRRLGALLQIVFRDEVETKSASTNQNQNQNP
jgi:hypothetical protein